MIEYVRKDDVLEIINSSLPRDLASEHIYDLKGVWLDEVDTPQTDKELRTLDEILANLEMWSTWNKTFANAMIGSCSKMRNLLAGRKTDPITGEPYPCDKLNFVPPIITDEPYKDDCTGCRFVGTYDTEFPCANCVRKNKDYYDSEQTERSE